MDPSAIMTPATGAVNSRFETQENIDQARETRKKEWQEAYERIGQAPPEEPETDYDSRTLYERLEAQKTVKTEEWDARMKLSNQWRGLDADEKRFLAEKEAEKRAEQKKLEDAEAEEVRQYRERLAARQTGAADTPPPVSSGSASKSVAKSVPLKAAKKKDVKSLMKGIVVKKKPKVKKTSETPSSVGSKEESPAANTHTGTKREAPEDTIIKEEDKRRKVD